MVLFFGASGGKTFTNSYLVLFNTVNSNSVTDFTPTVFVAITTLSMLL